MKVISSVKAYKLKPGAVLTIGNFDGFHIGHQSLINRVVQTARKNKKPSVLLTFHPHPSYVLRPSQKPQCLYSLEKTKQLLSLTGLEALVVEPFTTAFSKLSPEDFIKKKVMAYIKPSVIITAGAFRFGAGGKGSYSLLSRLSKQYGFDVKKQALLKKQGRVVSSSFIKKLIFKGRWRLISRLLGRDFSVEGRAIKGFGRGQKLGFPTINLKTAPHYITPVTGVYAATLHYKSKLLPAVMNVGTNPTFSKTRAKKIEVHIIGKNITWTNPKCEVSVLKYLRPEKKFSRPSALSSQIKQDIEKAKKYF